MNRDSLMTPYNVDPNLVSSLLSHVHPVSVEEVREKLVKNQINNDKFLAGDFKDSLEIYFSFFSNQGVGALKFNSQGVRIRKRSEDGLRLIDLPPYFEFSEFALSPELRGQGLVKYIYKNLMDYLSSTILTDGNLLMGGVGLLKNDLNDCYSRGLFKKDQEFISYSDIPAGIIENLEKVRPQTISTKVYAEKMGLDLIGSSKTHGGPIYFTNSIFGAKKLLYQSLEKKL
jgi:hypothetical protein